MQRYITFIVKLIRLTFTILRIKLNKLYTFGLLYSNNVQFKKFNTNGIPYFMVARVGICIIGDKFNMNNGLHGNPIGRPQPCIFFVDKGATLQIGNNVGMSATAILAHQSITIGDNVKIGGGVCIYDTDFHSLDAKTRANPKLDIELKNKAPVFIGDNVFIGAHSTILKGVTLGDNAVIGACSVVTKNVPANEIWAGNPAKLIRAINLS
jgi:acetyltransferase-like isoleucine patch superfamily enzyme